LSDFEVTETTRLENSAAEEFPYVDDDDDDDRDVDEIYQVSILRIGLCHSLR
jgi:hypothetical protein